MLTTRHHIHPLWLRAHRHPLGRPGLGAVTHARLHIESVYGVTTWVMVVVVVVVVVMVVVMVMVMAVTVV